MTDLNGLLGMAEVVKATRYSRERLHQLRRLGLFPQPVATLAAGMVWARADVEEWIREHGVKPVKTS